MFEGLVIKPAVNWGLFPIWVGINIEAYGCEGLGHHGLKFSLELAFIEFMLCVGKRYETTGDTGG